MLKKLTLALASLAIALAPLASAVKVSADTNLLANPSVEASNNAGNPANWKADVWGNNTTTISYKNEGHTGNKSLYIDMTARTSGDAKWMADPVAVSPSTKYTYSDYYKSNVSTELDIQYTDNAGKVSYAYLQTLPAASSWVAANATFTTPANAAKVVLLHIIYTPGWLQTDDFSLSGNTTSSTGGVKDGDPVDVTGATALLADNSNVIIYLPEGGHRLYPTPQVSDAQIRALAGKTVHVAGTAAISDPNQPDIQNHYPIRVLSISDVNAPKPQPPTVSITTPVANASLSGSQTITADASDSKGVSSVQFKLDGNDLGAQDTAAPYSYSWDTTTASNGPHSLTAIAINTSGLSATSSPVNVTVQNQTTPPPTADNLIQNPSFETANGTVPAGWNTDSWGTNTHQFTYSNMGHTGSHSATVAITQYTSGDAKWDATPVNITGSKTYLYADYYKSNINSRVVAAFIDNAGNYSYQELTGAAAATDWTKYASEFTAPASATKVTMFHLIDAVGSLTIDDVSLSEYTPPTPAPGAYIANPSVETADPANSQMPAGWAHSSWGNNTPKFEYVNGGHTGNKSVKVTVSNYTDGDAKWYFNPVTTLTPSNQYRFTTWYKTNTIPHAVAMFLDAQGNEHFFGMPNPQPSGSTTEWQKYSDTFEVPSYAVAATAFLFLPGNGWVQVDDQSLAPYTPTGWNRPLVTLTFDDSEEDNVTTALPLLQSYGFKFTQCFATTFIENDPANANRVMQFKNAGEEICDHTVTHPFLTSLSTADVDYELSHSQSYLRTLTGEPVVDFASPYGDYNASVNNEIKKYFQAHRTVDEGYNSKDNFDPYRLRVQNMLSTTTLAEFQSWIDQAKKDNTWLIIVYHRVADDPEQYDTTISNFQQQMAALNASGLTVKTMADALTEVKAQL